MHGRRKKEGARRHFSDLFQEGVTILLAPESRQARQMTKYKVPRYSHG